MFLWDAPAREDDAAHTLNKLMAVPMPPAVAAPFSERFNLELLPQGLGQSEAMRLVAPVDGRTQPPGSCGSLVSELRGQAGGRRWRRCASGRSGRVVG